ncbi:unnamed protein product [Protopolystoma xenopodis]|uniref:Uncharacterized protein n=1 Tax=Protopolystoma xenopodis TaxID=117903 RepID=A0A448XMT3_9PLAT|nr:unnamed protein product [Protopolystoma xenopodis]
MAKLTDDAGEKFENHQVALVYEFVSKAIASDLRPSNHLIPGALHKVYHGILVGNSVRRELLAFYNLSRREYLGNTTMDVRLAGLMANCGLCRPGSLVWDPFLGAGGLALAASASGALAGGCDIDYSLVHGLGMSPKAGKVSMSLTSIQFFVLFLFYITLHFYLHFVLIVYILIQKIPTATRMV